MTMSTNLGWTKIKTGAEYAGVSERTFRDWLKQGLKHIRLYRTICEIQKRGCGG